ncbi:MAG: O-antigen ligase family protein [Bacillota bacterium]|nr:hypothetical protein [Candidatus Fermentithermobacillaceae bacterium]
MRTLPAFTEGHYTQSGSLHTSFTHRLLGAVSKRIDHALGVFFAWFDNAFRHSICGRAVLDLNERFARWIPASVGVRCLKLLVASHGRHVTAGTFLGIVLGLGAFLPTEIQLVCFALFLFLYLWWRWGSKNSVVSLRLGEFPGPGEAPRSAGGSGNGRIWFHLPFKVVLPLVVLFMFIAGAAVSSVIPRRSLMNLVLWCSYGLVFAAALDMSSRGEEDSIIWPFLTGVTLSSMIGIYQYLSGWQATRSSWLDEKFQDEITRVIGTFDNPTFFAEMIGLALPVTLALLIRNKSFLDKGILLVYAAIQGAALVLTWSRGAWLGFIASFALLAVLFDKRLMLVGLIAAMLAVIVAPPVLVERLLSSFSLEDSSNSYRVFIWRGSLALLREHIFRGVGLGADSFAQVYPEYMIIQTPAPHAHSTYLQMLIELGLCGFLALIWLLLVCGWQSLRVLFTQKGVGFERWARVGVLSGVVAAVGGHMLQGLVEHTWYNPQITVVFWAWTGVAVGISYGMEARR